MNTRSRQIARRAAKALLFLVAIEMAWVAYAALRPATVPPQSIVARAVATAPVLPEEFRAIEPAGTDGSLPNIPVAEVWPAQR